MQGWGPLHLGLDLFHETAHSGMHSRGMLYYQHKRSRLLSTSRAGPVQQDTRAKKKEYMVNILGEGFFSMVSGDTISTLSPQTRGGLSLTSG